jgi:osmotically-inducible protein OsmY
MKSEAIQQAIKVAAIAAFSTFVTVATASAASRPAVELHLAGIGPHITVTQVDDITILQGTATTVAEATHAEAIAHQLGYQRVANLVRIVAVPDDDTIERIVERRIFLTRALDGAHLRVNCVDGYLTVEGTVIKNSQKEVTRDILFHIGGVKSVQVILSKS